MDVLLVVDRRGETMGTSCATMILTKYFNMFLLLRANLQISQFFLTLKEQLFREPNLFTMCLGGG